MDVLASDGSIKEVCVEDPAPAFQRLRDVVSIDRAMHLKLLDSSVLFPDEELGGASTMSCTGAAWAKYSFVLRKYLLESPHQRYRLNLLLKIAKIVPSSVIGSTESTKLRGGVQADSRRKRLAPMEESNLRPSLATSSSKEAEEQLMSWQQGNEKIREIRLKEKRKLRLDSLEWYSQLRSLGEVQHQLEIEWSERFKSICASLRVLRRLHAG